jgi:amino acid adenylation domain-containing protein
MTDPNRQDLENRALQRILASVGSSAPQPLPKCATVLRPTRLQERLLAAEALSGRANHYCLARAFIIERAVNKARLEQTFAALVLEQPMLRAHFVTEAETGARRLCLLDSSAISLRWVTPERFEDALLAAFDTEAGPLVRARIAPHDDSQWLLGFSAHHVILDGAGFTRLMERFEALYESPVPREPRDFWSSYHRFIEIEARQEEAAKVLAEKAGAFDWLRPVPSPLSTMRGSLAETPAGGSIAAEFSFSLPDNTSEELRRRARAAGVTDFALLASAFAMALSQFFGRRSFCLGFNRQTVVPEDLEDLLVPRVQLSCFRVGMAAQTELVALAMTLQGQLLETLRHGDLPFGDLLRVLGCDRSLKSRALFQVGISQQRQEGRPLRLGDGKARGYPLSPAGAEFSIELEVGGLQDECPSFRLRYDKALLNPNAMDALAESFRTICRAAGGGASVVAARLTGAIDARLLEGPPPLEPEAERALFDGRFRRCCAEAPDRLAIRDEFESLSYAELDDRADAIAHYLSARCIQRETPICTYLPRSADLCAAIIGIMRAGLAYCPLDVDWPEARVASVVRAARAPLILTRHDLADSARCIGPEQCVITLQEASRCCESVGPTSAPTDRSLAYLIFTSGSTGQPKGVAIEQAGLVNHLEAKNATLEILATDCIANTASPGFDISIWQFLSPLLAGASIDVFSKSDVGDPERLLARIARGRASILQLTPTQIAVMLEMLEAQGDAERDVMANARLRVLVPTGERLPGGLVSRWFDCFPDIPMVNAYGPAECSDDVAQCRLTRATWTASSAPPVGQTLMGLRLYVLDDFLRLLGPGRLGDIWVGGVGVGRGYWRAPRSTAESFRPDPFASEGGARMYRTGDLGFYDASGEITLLGRKDNQLKMAGVRIELEEIEETLRGAPGVSEAAVHMDTSGLVAQLHGFVVMHSGQPFMRDVIIGHCAGLLPESVVPHVLDQLASLPISSSGKLDRGALATLASQRPPASGTLRLPDATSARLAELWQHVLKAPITNPDLDFFAAGGSSVTLGLLLGLIRRDFAVPLTLERLYAHRTLSGMAALVAESAPTSSSSPPAVQATMECFFPLTVNQLRIWKDVQIRPDGDVTYLLIEAIVLTGPPDTARLDAALVALVTRHDGLRLTFHDDEDGPVQRLGPPPAHVLETVLVSDEIDFSLALTGVCEGMGMRAFDLSHDSMLRAVLVSDGKDGHALVLTTHHIACDGLSLDILIEELDALYAGREEDLPPPVSFCDYARSGAVALPAEAGRFWIERIGAAEGRIGLPYLTLAPASEASAIVRRISLDLQATEALVRTAAENAVSLFVVIAAVLSRRLGRLCSQEAVVLGVDHAGRRFNGELSRVVGFLLERAPLRVVLEKDSDDAVLFRRIDAALAEILSGAPPLDTGLLASVRGGAPSFFDVTLTMNEPRRCVLSLGDLTGRLHEVARDGAPDTLSIDVWPEQDKARRLSGLTLELRADATRLSPGTVDYLAFDLKSALTVPAENSACSEPPKDKPPLAQDSISVFRAPGDLSATFCEDAKQRIDWRTALRLADAITAAILRHAPPTTPMRPVAILTGYQAQTACAIMGAWNAGAPWALLDSDDPEGRSAARVRTLAPGLILCDPRVAPLRAAELATLSPGTAIIDIATLGEAEPAPRCNLPNQAAAYLVFTSGSTGAPRAVVLTRESFLRHQRNMARGLGLGPGDRLAQTAPAGFDIAIWQFVGAQAEGGASVVLPEACRRDPLRLLDAIERNGITVIELVPFMVEALVDLRERQEISAPPASLRAVVSTGEAISARLVAQWRSVFPQIALYNAYGPAECGDDVSLTLLDRDDPSRFLPDPDLGRPFDGVHFDVIGPDLAPVGVFTTGQLAIGGPTLGWGYLGNPRETALRFVPAPQTRDPGERMFLSGDRVRHVAPGLLGHAGRVDHLLKIGGRLVDPNEIASILSEADGVWQAAVRCFPSAGGAEILAYLVPAPGRGHGEETRLISAAQAQVAALLPSWMRPLRYRVLKALPRTPNGKLDVDSLTYFEPGSLETGRARNAVEAEICRVCAEILERPAVAPTQDLFDLGAASLAAIRIVAQANALFEGDLRVADIFNCRTARRLAERIRRRPGRAARPMFALEPLAPGQIVPLSPAQRRLWFVNALNRGEDTYLELGGLWFAPGPPVAAIRQAMMRLVQRHDALRMRILQREGVPFAVVGQGRDPEITEEGCDAADMDHMLKERLAQMGEAPFELSTGPVARLHILRNRDGRLGLALAIHHIACDGWSMEVLLREFVSLVQEPDAALAPVPTYSEFALWKSRQDSNPALERERAYWRACVEDVALSILPCAEGVVDAPTSTQRSGVIRIALTQAKTAALRRMARRHGASLHMAVVAAYFAALHRVTGQSDFVIGMVTSGRSDAALDKVVGCFVDILPIRVTLDAAAGFDVLLRAVRERVLEAFDHDGLSYDEIVCLLGHRRLRTPLLEAALVLQNLPFDAADLRGLSNGFEIHHVNPPSPPAHFPLVLELEEAEGMLEGHLRYQPSCVSPGLAESVATLFSRATEAMAEDPTRSVSALRVALQPQPKPDHESGAGAIARIVETALFSPDAPALVDGLERWSYGELLDRSLAVAHGLESVGNRPGRPVVLRAEASAQSIATVLGCALAQAPFLPLDPDLPPQVVAEVCRRARSNIVLAHGPEWLSAAESCGAHYLLLDHLADAAPPFDRLERARSRAAALEPDQPAYLIYTSGSTGPAKLVQVPHRGLTLCVETHEEVYQEKPERMALFPKLCFDSAIIPVFWPLATGGTVYVIPDRQRSDPNRLADFCETHVITHWLSLSEVFHVLLESSGAGQLGALQCAIVAGDAILPGLATLVRERLPRCALWNEYGPSETSVWATVSRCHPKEPVGSIGRPIPGCRINVAGTDGEACDCYEIGELVIAGDGVADGYVGDPRETALRFRPDPQAPRGGARVFATGDIGQVLDDGEIRFLGRRDNLVKIAGTRVQLEELDRILSDIPGARRGAAAVLRGENGTADRLAVGYEGEADSAAVRRTLADRLPPHAMPTVIAKLDGLPRLASGKIDRGALAQRLYETCRQDAVTPVSFNETEVRLAQIWTAVLGVAPERPETHFFELGGASIQMMQLLAKIRTAFDVVLPLNVVLGSATVAEMAALIEAARAASPPFGTLNAATISPVILMGHASTADPKWAHILVFYDERDAEFVADLTGRLPDAAGVFSVSVGDVSACFDPLAEADDIARALMLEHSIAAGQIMAVVGLGLGLFAALALRDRAGIARCYLFLPANTSVENWAEIEQLACVEEVEVLPYGDAATLADRLVNIGPSAYDQ